MARNQIESERIILLLGLTVQEYVALEAFASSSSSSFSAHLYSLR